MLELREVVSEQGKHFSTSRLARMSSGNGDSIAKGSSSEVSHLSRFKFDEFQQRLAQRFDDVMNSLKSILLHVSRLENHHHAGISSKSGDGRFSRNNPCHGNNLEHIEISTSKNSCDRYGDKENHDLCMKLELPCFNGLLKIEEYLDWLSEMERFFDYTKILDEKQAMLVAYKLKGIVYANTLVHRCVKMRKRLKHC